MNKLTSEDIEARAKRGVELFKQGYNCSQSVVGAYCDLFDIPFDVAMRMSASFGGGMGRMRLTCGAATGMFMLAGLDNGLSTPGEPQKRAENYSLVQKLAEEFKELNGSLTCAELLGMRAGKVDIPLPSTRTPEYYRSRPCSKMVESACEIFGNHLLEKSKSYQD